MAKYGGIVAALAARRIANRRRRVAKIEGEDKKSEGENGGARRLSSKANMAYQQ